MTSEPQAEFAKRMMLLARSAEHFQPSATYDPDGDCIEFLAKPDPFYAERVDDLVTVYYSQETQEVIGSLIKRVASFCQRLSQQLPGFCIEIRHGRVRLVHLFLAGLWSTQHDPTRIKSLVYRKLIEVADEVEVDAELALQ